jgi:transposase
MARIKLPHHSISLGDLGRLLASEHRRHARTRLRALKMVLKGATVSRIAKAARTNKAAVERWLRIVRKDGVNALLDIAPREIAITYLSEEDVDRLREEIRKALHDGVNERLEHRLKIIDRCLFEGSTRRAADAAGLLPDTVSNWLLGVKKIGLRALIFENGYRLPRNAPGLEAARLQELIEVEVDPRMRKRLRALLRVAEGEDFEQAAVWHDLSSLAVEDWSYRFRKGSVDALHDRPLDRAAQRRELKAFVRRHARMDFEVLFKCVGLRFAQSYSRRYVKCILDEVLGAS